LTGVRLKVRSSCWTAGRRRRPPRFGAIRTQDGVGSRSVVAGHSITTAVAGRISSEKWRCDVVQQEADQFATWSSFLGPPGKGVGSRQREVAEEEGAGRRSVGINQRLPISLVAAKASVEQLTIKLNTHTTLGSWRPCARCTPARAPSNASRSPRSDYCRCLMKSIQVPRSDYYQLRTTHAKCSSK
jgi:hypothetical protein